MDNIEIVDEKKNKSGEYQKISFRFGPHYMVEINKKGRKTIFKLVATHHGFQADASDVNGELEKLIYEIRESHSKNTID